MDVTRTNTCPRSVVVQIAAPRVRDHLITAVISNNRNKQNTEKLNSSGSGLTGRNTPVLVLEHLSPSNKALHPAEKERREGILIYLGKEWKGFC